MKMKLLTGALLVCAAGASFAIDSGSSNSQQVSVNANYKLNPEIAIRVYQDKVPLTSTSFSIADNYDGGKDADQARYDIGMKYGKTFDQSLNEDSYNHTYALEIYDANANAANATLSGIKVSYTYTTASGIGSGSEKYVLGTQLIYPKTNQYVFGKPNNVPDQLGKYTDLEPSYNNTAGNPLMTSKGYSVTVSFINSNLTGGKSNESLYLPFNIMMQIRRVYGDITRYTGSYKADLQIIVSNDSWL